MKILRMHLLGGIRLSQGSRLLSNDISKKGQALLCYLVVTDRPQSRDKLAALFWSDFPDHRARANLRDTLSDLHRALPHHLFIDQNNIAFINNPTHSWIDAAIFQIGIEQAQHRLRMTPSPAMLPAELIARLEEGVKLYRGELLAGFSIRRAALFDDWLASWRERLRQQAVEALQILATYYSGKGEYAAGIRHGKRLLELDPWREEGHRQLMRLLTLSGQQSAALKQYEICRQVLGDELFIEPAAETEALFAAIRAGDIRSHTIETRGYELLELIGEGQLSSVYKAFQPAIRREVAVKIVHAEELSDLAFFDRFEAIAQAVAGLEFPWIVPLYDYWREADAAYVIMRLLRGGNMQERAADRPWSPQAAMQLLDQVATALAAAHEVGIVHGNLKPANILLDEAGNAYLSDFGRAGDSRHFRAGEYGVYLAPEQELGQPGTARSDVYALGMILGELLGGTACRDRRSVVGLDERAATEKSQPLPDLDDAIPAAVDAVISRATAGRPELRYADGLALASAFRQAVKSDPVVAPTIFTGLFRRKGASLPLDNTSFIGREDELLLLDKLITDPTVHLITLAGPGGIGKTRLALAAARSQSDRQRHGVYFIPLAALESTAQMITATAVAFDLPAQDESGLKQQLLDYVLDKHLLLILDNFEHLISGKDLLVEMIGSAPRLTILVTSREVLHLREEHLLQVGGLNLAESETAEAVLQADASKLFLQSARRLQPDYRLYETDFIPLKQLCQLVEGLPLAIELAAGWANKISLSQLEYQLRRSMDFLRTEEDALPERHSSMQAVFAASWERLSEQDQDVFRNLSVFRGGFVLDAARRIGGISFGALSRLLSKSLLQFNRESDRYQIHELLRQFAADKLAQNKKKETAVIVEHATYYCRLLGEKENDLKGIGQDAALAAIDADLGNIKKAWNSAAEMGLVNLIELALDSLALTYRYRVQPDEFVTACQVVLQHFQNLVVESDRSMQFRRVLGKVTAMQASPYMHATIGSEFLVTKESTERLESCRQVFQTLSRAGEEVRKEHAYVLMRLGALLLNSEMSRSSPLLEESLALYQQLGDRWGESEALLVLSSARLRLRDYDSAKPLWEESLAIKRQEGDNRGLADSLTMLGMRAASHNQTADTRLYAQECYDTCLRINDRSRRADAHWNFGVLMAWAGDYVQAKQSLSKAEMFYIELGLHPPALILGNALAMLGEYDAVVEYVSLFMSRIGGREDKPNEARAYNWLGYVALARGEYAEAQRCCLKSAAAYEACGFMAYAGFIYGLLALVAQEAGNPLTALRNQEKGLRIQMAGSQLGPLGIWLCAPVTAVLLAANGFLAEALSAYAFATNHPMVANSSWFADVPGRMVRTAVSTLTAEEAAQAQKLGRQAEPWEMGAELLELVSELADSSRLSEKSKKDADESG